MKTKYFFLGIFLISSLIFLAHFAHVGKAVYGDGRYYYSYLAAFLIGHTLNLSQSFLHTDIPTWFSTPLGLPANIYPIGPALFWTVPYLLSYGVGLLFGFGPYSVWYQIPVGLFVILLSTVGLFLLYQLQTPFFKKRNIILSTISIFLATNLLFYGAVDVINSHALTFFLSSLLLFLWIQKPNTKHAIFEGIIIGLLMLIRPQEAIFLVLPLTTLVLERQKIMLLSPLMTALVFSPQILIWKLEWGNFFVNPYLHVATFNFLRPQFWGVLFNPGTGLFLWTPIIILALAGLVLFSKKQPKVGIPMLLVFFLELYVISSWSIWWEGASYSARMFISSLPFLGIGLTYLFEQKLFVKLKYFLVPFFSILNVVLIIYFLLTR